MKATIKATDKQPLDAERGKTFKVFPEDAEIPPPGHFLHDPGAGSADAVSRLARKIESVGWFGVAMLTRLDDRVFVLLGRDRTLAAREVNRKRKAAGEPPLKIEVQYRKCPDVATAIRMMVAENKGRRQITQAADSRYAKLLHDTGLSIEMIASELECSEATVRGFLKLAEQPEFVLAAVTRGEISVAKARALKGTDEEKEGQIVAIAAKGGAGAGKGRKKDPAKVAKVLKHYGLDATSFKALQAELRAL